MDWLEWGYLGIFAITFLSATVIPFASEALVVAAVVNGFNPIGVLIVASTGNWLGGMSTYGIGWFSHWKRLARWFNKDQQRVQKWKPTIDQYGPWTALLCWAPIIGDVIALALGFFRVRPMLSAILMFIGKALRYALVIWGTAWLIP